MRKAIGERGSWFARLAGERLPCVHEHWCRTGRDGMRYDDPGFEPGSQKWEEFVAALRATGRAILTKDKISGTGHHFERSGYVALFEIAGVEADAAGLRFRFTKRVEDLP